MGLLNSLLHDWAHTGDSVFAPGRPGPAPVPEFQLKVTLGSDRQPKLDFASLHLSDEHAMSQAFAAKAACGMMQHTAARHYYYLGDGLDLEARARQDSSETNIWHHHYLAHMLRKAEKTPSVRLIGNHDIELSGRQAENRRGWHRRLAHKMLFGLAIEHSAEHTDAKGRRFKLIHGHAFADAVLGRAKGKLYYLGDMLYAATPKLDGLLQTAAGTDDFHFTHGVRARIDQRLKLRAAIAKAADRNTSYDGYIHGHFHRPDIARTPKGKLVIDVGSSTEHPRALVEDWRGTLALMVWKPDGIILCEENGARRTFDFAALGLGLMRQEPAQVYDKHFERAGRLLRLAEKLWPVRGPARSAKPPLVVSSKTLMYPGA